MTKTHKITKHFCCEACHALLHTELKEGVEIQSIKLPKALGFKENKKYLAISDSMFAFPEGSFFGYYEITFADGHIGMGRGYLCPDCVKEFNPKPITEAEFIEKWENWCI